MPQKRCILHEVSRLGYTLVWAGRSCSPGCLRGDSFFLIWFSRDFPLLLLATAPGVSRQPHLEGEGCINKLDLQKPGQGWLGCEARLQCWLVFLVKFVLLLKLNLIAGSRVSEVHRHWSMSSKLCQKRPMFFCFLWPRWVLLLVSSPCRPGSLAFNRLMGHSALRQRVG